MNIKVTRVLFRALLVAVAALAVTPVAGFAAVVPMQATMQRNPPVAQRQIRPNAAPAARGTWKPRRLGPHTFYGTITAINGSIITMHLRSGHILDVDATAAIANGDYSAPLFVGKLVSVDGDEAAGKFTAEHIFRLTNLGSLNADK